MSKTTDVSALIAFHTAPPALPSPVAPRRDPLRARRDAQRRFDRDGLPRGLREVA